MKFNQEEIDILDDAINYWIDKAELDDEEVEIINELRRKIRANQ